MELVGRLLRWTRVQQRSILGQEVSKGIKGRQNEDNWPITSCRSISPFNKSCSFCIYLLELRLNFHQAQIIHSREEMPGANRSLHGLFRASDLILKLQQAVLWRESPPSSSKQVPLIFMLWSVYAPQGFWEAIKRIRPDWQVHILPRLPLSEH